MIPLLPQLAKLLLSPFCQAPAARQALRDLVTEMRLDRHHRRSCRRAKRYVRSNSPLKLNIGCGPNVRQGWINIDLFAKSADLRLDVRRPLPFAADSAERIYSEHLFEHMEFPGEAMLFLRESLRVLQPGGIFSVGVPDTEWPLRAYVEGDELYFRLAREGRHPAWCNTRLHSVNYHFRQIREHKYAYDLETLTCILTEAGFADVRPRSFDATLDCESRRIGTLYVDASKPAASRALRHAA